MKKWIIGAIVVVVVGYVAYDFIRPYFLGGFHTRPEMPEGAFSFSFRNGLRAILVGLPDVRPERKYIGVTYEVPRWYEDAWSFCSAPSAEEESQTQDLGPGSRLEAVCRIKVDESEILRGAIYSVPDL